MRRPALLALVASLSLVTGCASDAPAASGSSCVGGAGACVDLVQMPSNLEAQATCIDVLGSDFTFVAGAVCPGGTGLVGSCDVAQAGVRFTVQYYDPWFGAGTAAARCTALGGVFRVP
jgi:hypothetical protein